MPGADFNHSHEYDSIIDPSNFSSHPEWFAYYNGQRIPDGQLCLTNADVRIRAKSHTGNVLGRAMRVAASLSPADAGIPENPLSEWGWCHCPNCFPQYDPDSHIRHATHVLNFNNYVDEWLATYYPDRYVCYYADYINLPGPPVRRSDGVVVMTAHPKVIPVIVNRYGCVLHDLDDPTCSVNVDFNWKLNAWTPAVIAELRNLLKPALLAAQQDVVRRRVLREWDGLTALKVVKEAYQAYATYQNNSTSQNRTAAREALGRAYYLLDETAPRDVVASYKLHLSLEEDIEGAIGSPITPGCPDIHTLYYWTLPSDLNQDCYVGLADLSLFATDWLTSNVLDVQNGNSPPNSAINIYAVSPAQADWQEGNKNGESVTLPYNDPDGGVTWNNFANAFTGSPIASADWTELSGGDVAAATIPAAVVQGWIDGTNPGLFLKLADEASPDSGSRFAAKENLLADAAKLSFLAQSPDVQIVLEPSRDAYLKEKLPDTNFGTNTQPGAYVNDTLQKFRSVLGFDLSPYAGATVTGDATLAVTLAMNRGGVVAFHPVNPAKADWEEGDDNGLPGGPYNDPQGGVTWNNFAHEYVGTPIVMVDWSGFNVGDTATVPIPASVVQGWIDGTNAGLLVKLNNESLPNSGYEYASKENVIYTHKRLIFQINQTGGEVLMEIPPARDAYLTENFPDNNFGVAAQPGTFVNNDLTRCRSVIGFDLAPYADYIVAGDAALSVTLVEGGDQACLDVWLTQQGIGADLGRNCYVQTDDFSRFARYWLLCNNPQDNNCP